VSKDAQRWIYDPAPSDGPHTKYMSFLTPIGGIAAPAKDAGSETNGPQYCGKAVFSDLHAGGNPSTDVPGTCPPASAGLSAQLKALEFLFFDLSACVSPDTEPPTTLPPPAK
jgi:hypothetical protein